MNRRLPDGRTPLFAAAESGEIRAINALLDRGARVNEVVLDATARESVALLRLRGEVSRSRAIAPRG